MTTLTTFDVLSWLAALVALLTATAMLRDDCLMPHGRARAKAAMSRAWTGFRAHGLNGLTREEWITLLRFILRAATLTLIMAAAGVDVLLPRPGHMEPYEVLLRLGLTSFLVLQSPCPWWRYIAFGESST